ncbi:DUF2059 domain-containing protein [Beijerinckia sp. L45]|uniref:DUF2059 domain-containing protein n=1 Tax=Beijerinckia sp. L45 TaxID=1641855 RepID=UPI00131D70BE|nr:DUF2059 domain-containing protein [Beijerinckia sp. L45]
MMTRKAMSRHGLDGALFLAAAAVLAAAPSAHAQSAVPGFQPPLPSDIKQVQDQLASYDQVAVAAARHYYQSPNVKKDMVAMIQGLTPSIVASVEKDKGAPLDAVEQKKLATALDKATQANLDLLLGLNMVAAVETLSKEQLLALDQFYTSPMGQSILASTPQLNQRLPAIFQNFMPKYSVSVDAEMKAVGLGPN